MAGNARLGCAEFYRKCNLVTHRVRDCSTWIEVMEMIGKEFFGQGIVP